MNLYIMSRGRAGKVTTLASIPPSWRHKTFLIVPQSEFHDYVKHHAKDGTGITAAPYFVTNYSQKFQWILNGLPLPLEDWITGRGEVPPYKWEDKAVILDDDLVFSKRNEQGKLITVRDPVLLEPMWCKVEELLDAYPLVSVHPRQMGHATPPGHVENGRVICVQGINRSLIGPVKVDQHPILADVRLNLTLLGRGDRNALITDYFQDHGPCQAPGGCSIYRTPQLQELAIDSLVERWPGYVRKVIRKPKQAKWLGDERVEYTAQWKKLQRDAPDKVRV